MLSLNELQKLSRQKIRDAEALLRYHETLLFVRAYPVNAAVARLAENELRGFPRRVARLEEQGVDLSNL